MNLAIAMAQFITLALGVMAARIMVSSGAIADGSRAWDDRIALFAANQGVWLLLIPAAWIVVANICGYRQSALLKGVQGVGVGIAVWILIITVLVLVF